MQYIKNKWPSKPFRLNKRQTFLWLVVSFFSLSFTNNHLSTYNKPPKEEAAKHYVMADRFYKKGKVKKAIRHLKKAIRLDATNENYINKLANIYHNQKKYRQALRYISKTREFIEDYEPKQTIQMLNWEGCYALSYDMKDAAFRRFQKAAHLMDQHHIVDSLLKASIYCNWGVAELYDQGKNDPCDTIILGECYQIHITDVRRAVERFKVALKFNPSLCYKEARWNYALTNKMLKIPQDTLTKYMGYLPKKFVRNISISAHDTLCPEPLVQQSDTSVPKELNLTAFKNISKYKEVLYVLDISGSMEAPISTEVKTPRFEMMNRLIKNEIMAADSSQRIGLLTVNGSCSTPPLVAIPVSADNRVNLLYQVSGLKPYGGTPLYSTLNMSPDYFTNDKNEKIVLLASDGLESCLSHLSVCQLAEELCNQGIKIEVFSLLLDERANYNAFGLYQCMSDACQTEFTSVNEKGNIDEQSIKAPIGCYSMIINREDVLTGTYKASF